MTNLVCSIFSHKFDKFRMTEWGIPYDTGYIEHSDFCYRCGRKHE